MSEKKKALVIRFNSIGDIVLTTPCVQALAEAGYVVHYLTKSAFSEILAHNEHVDHVWKLEDELSSLLPALKAEGFDVVIDLHNNLRSSKVKSALSCQAFTLQKNRFSLWLLTQTPFKSHQEKHIVYRFLDVLKPLGISSDGPSTNYFLPVSISHKESLRTLPGNFLAIAVGAAWETKSIPTEKLVSIIKETDFSEVVLLGGKDDVEKAAVIESQASRPIINLVGELSINESAYVVSKSSAVLTGDTGMMHIAAAFEVPAIAVFGSTHPALGYTPFYAKNAQSQKLTHFLVQNERLSCRPCTKQGKSKCPKAHFKCMLDLNNDEIIEKIDSFI